MVTINIPPNGCSYYCHPVVGSQFADRHQTDGSAPEPVLAEGVTDRPYKMIPHVIYSEYMTCAINEIPYGWAGLRFLRESRDLTVRISETNKPPMVFPGRNSTHPLTDIKWPWKAVRDRAGLEDFRLHDLRHTFASRVVSDTGSLYVAGQLLGHTQAQTTARYIPSHRG